MAAEAPSTDLTAEERQAYALVASALNRQSLWIIELTSMVALLAASNGIAWWYGKQMLPWFDTPRLWGVPVVLFTLCMAAGRQGALLWVARNRPRLLERSCAAHQLSADSRARVEHAVSTLRPVDQAFGRLSLKK